MRVTDTFLYVVLFLWASVIFIGGWADRYDWNHDHKQISVYYANGHKKVIYTICGDTAKVHASGLHGELSSRLKHMILDEQAKLAEMSE